MSMHAEVSSFCAAIGADPLLVQGAGGNVSWKDGDTLWIKASGTWLKNALQEDIFVPVDLVDLRSSLSEGQFNVTPKALGEAALRPSIETVLHALLPQPVVVHIHAIDVLSWLVRPQAWALLQRKLPARWHASFVPYRKPGAELARVVHDAVQINVGTQLVCMGNHGIVMAGDSLDEVRSILNDVIAALRVPVNLPQKRALVTEIEIDAQRTLLPVDDPIVQGLDVSAAGLAHMSSAWALYPDHVVFLGAQPICHDSVAAAIECCRTDPAWGADHPHFIRDTGVFAFPLLPAGRLAQLRCYADVLLRTPPQQPLQTLSTEDVAALLNWDAERYRQQLNQRK